MSGHTSNQASSSSEGKSGLPSLPAKRTVEEMLDRSILIEEIAIEHRYIEPVNSNYDISWEEWYTDVSDSDDSDEEWLESFLSEPRITEVDLFDDICNELEEVTNAVIEEHEEFEAIYHRPNKRRYVTFREHFSLEE
ncbi:hypothetical protein K7432_011688 [Basidiobolus ranarum]|uniref:Uncharacterized protein n=1 Tax=Basidiobolus ranarum TaxID=34480 RepID=A0ABR2WLU5_9FUNG